MSNTTETVQVTVNTRTAQAIVLVAGWELGYVGTDDGGAEECWLGPAPLYEKMSLEAAVNSVLERIVATIPDKFLPENQAWDTEDR